MPQSSDWQRALETGMQFTELRRSQARAIVADLVAQGQVARDQMAAAIEEVIDMSRRRREDLRKMVQAEVQRQLRALGLATKADLDKLERRIAKVSREVTKKKEAPKKASKKASKTAPKAG
jgi:polyhydroxyalkanoate synthesis regulator phasin